MPMDVLDRILRPLRLGPLTVRYPDVRPGLPPAARGMPEFEPARCDGNAACIAACPTGAIWLEPGTWTIDVGACIFCGACARACGPQAIQLGSRIELGTDERDSLVVVRARSGPA